MDENYIVQNYFDRRCCYLKIPAYFAYVCYYIHWYVHFLSHLGQVDFKLFPFILSRFKKLHKLFLKLFYGYQIWTLSTSRHWTSTARDVTIVVIGQTALESVFTNQSTCTKLYLNEHYGLDFTYLVHDLHTASGNAKTLTRKKFTF